MVSRLVCPSGKEGIGHTLMFTVERVCVNMSIVMSKQTLLRPIVISPTLFSI